VRSGSAMEGEAIDEFATLVERKAISDIGKLLYKDETAEIVRERFPDEVVCAEVVIGEWVSSLTEGNTIDINVPPSPVWYTARLLKNEGSSIFHLHYLGWDKRSDETKNLSECRCLPAYTMTVNRKKKKNIPRRKSYFVLEVIEEAPEEPPLTPILPTPRSRRMAHSAPTTEEKPQSKRPLPEDTPPSLPQPHHDEGTTPKKLKKEKDLAEEADWICAECGDMEASDDSDLLLCEGGCKRSFHMLCLGITSATERQRIIAGDAWVCDDCRRHRHTCMICHDEGDDDTVSALLSSLPPSHQSRRSKGVAWSRAGSISTTAV
jgi:hypothetical protein